MERLLKQGDDVGFVVGDTERGQVCIRTAERIVIVRVIIPGEVGGPHGVADETEPNTAAGAGEEAIHGVGSRRGRRDFVKYIACSVGQRSAKPFDRLIKLSFIDNDRIAGIAGVRKGNWRLWLQQAASIICGEPNVDGLAAAYGGTCQQAYTGERDLSCATTER